LNTNSRFKTPSAGRNIQPVRFALIFFCCFVLGIAVLLIPPVQGVDRKFTEGLVALAHKVVTICGGHATRQGAILRSPSGFAVEMRDGCNAVNVTILLCSAIFAFPAAWKMKTLGILGGAAIIQIVNLFRFITLFYLGQYSMPWFDFAHAYLWESLIVLDTMAVFWYWAMHVLRSATVSNTPISNAPA
jgi:exosortase H (IPTLxxWG-CTERM-specific)